MNLIDSRAKATCICEGIYIYMYIYTSFMDVCVSISLLVEDGPN